MRRHRPHRKSRGGCLTCKSRRVKCDESRPICSPCFRRSTLCRYQACGVQPPEPESDSSPEQVDYRHVHEQPSGGQHDSKFLSLFSRLPRSPLQQDPELAGAFLLAEYYQHAGPHLALMDKTETRARVWCDKIPALAFRHQGVRDGILAVAALSMWTRQLQRHVQQDRLHQLSGQDFLNFSAAYLRQAHLHYGRCIAQLQRELLSDMQDNADVRLACAVLLVPCGIAHARYDRQVRRLLNEHDIHLDELSKPSNCSRHGNGFRLDLNWMTHIRGLSSIRNTLESQHSLEETAVFPLFRSSDVLRAGCMPPLAKLESTTKSGLNHAGLLDHPMALVILTEGEDALDELHAELTTAAWHHSLEPVGAMGTASSGDCEVQICVAALQSLQSVVKRFTQSVTGSSPQPFFRNLIEWVWSVDGRFMDLLATGEVRCLAVFGHFLPYMILLERSWWIDDLGSSTIQDMLEWVDCKSCPNTSSSFRLDTLLRWPRRLAQLHRVQGSCDRATSGWQRL